MSDDLHFVAGLGQKLIGFRSSFSGPGFGSTGSRGVGIGRDGLDHPVDEFGLLARSFRRSKRGHGVKGDRHLFVPEYWGESGSGRRLTLQVAY